MPNPTDRPMPDGGGPFTHIADRPMPDCVRKFSMNPRLLNLWNSLAQSGGIFDRQTGPYPADHGIRHIRCVIENLAKLLDGSKNARNFPNLQEQDYTTLFAATMIHDVGMTRMSQAGANGPIAETLRLEHAHPNVIGLIAEHYLRYAGFQAHEINDIIAVAAAHADDNEFLAEKKLGRAIADHPVFQQTIFELCIRMLCVADFLDLGCSRLIMDVDLIDWNNQQNKHLLKHRWLNPSTIHDGVIGLTLTNRIMYQFEQAQQANQDPDFNFLSQTPEAEQQQQQLMECVGTLHKTREDLELMLKRLSIVTQCEWHLRPLDEDLFGRACPMSAGTELFGRELDTAMKNRDITRRFEVDWMGHSLYGRFVQNQEELNGKLKKLLQDVHLAMRVLLLDPNFDGQQACEVYEAQTDAQNQEGTRSILPSKDEMGKIVNGRAGDIFDTLKELKDNWIPKESSESLLEVRGTKRLLYASMVRFGDRMLLTPYRDGGLFNQSGAILFTSLSPLFRAYRAEFEAIWRNPDETRLLVHKSGNPKSANNPINLEVEDKNLLSLKTPSFNYERWLLNHSGHIQAWLSEKGLIIPPFELEIQPASLCNLGCSHCIGRHLNSSTILVGVMLGIDDLRHFESLFAWKHAGFKIERIRISGLTGDPLGLKVAGFTKALIHLAKVKYKREVVVFTNGVTLSDDGIRQSLRHVDYVHVSLDAACKKTFADTKGADFFDQIIQNTEMLCRSLSKNPDLKTQVGFGFVVTQRNFMEVETAIAVARSRGVNFIRFRRDIHRPDAISWRAWREARRAILAASHQQREGPQIWLTDIPRRHWSVESAVCWAQKYCVTVGPDARVYPCDHLTSVGEHCAFGSLRDRTLEQILCNANSEKRLCSVGAYCSQCPPFNQRANRLLSELAVLHEQYGWEQLKGWMSKLVADSKQ